MEDCIFCKIISGSIPSFKVYEDEYTLAFLDISPVNHGHTLVVPKKHFKNMEAIPQEELNKVMATVKIVGQAIKEKLSAASYNVSENNDREAGQIVPHIHFHVIPRFGKDKLSLWPQRPYPDGKAAEVLAKLKIN